MNHDELAPGRVLAGRFELLRPLGRGAGGSVWLAGDTYLDGAPAAVKALSLFGADAPAALARLKREVLLARRLRHPGIVAVHTLWEDPPYVLLSMEYAGGPTLASALARRARPYAVKEVLPCAAQLAAALDYAHGEGVLHRDVKPDNIVLMPDGAARILDFGIADAVTGAETHGDVSGTLLYISPEQLRGERLDGRADQYSLAATLYTLLAGQPPFASGALAADIQLTDPPPIPALSNAANGVIGRALAKRPEARFPTCRAFYDALAVAAGEACPWEEGEGPVWPGPRGGRRLHRTSSPEADTAVLGKRTGTVSHRQFGEALVQQGYITQTQLSEALDAQRRQGGRLGAVLCGLGYVDEEQVLTTLAAQLNLPRAAPETLARGWSFRGILSQTEAERHLCLPYERKEDILYTAMADPLNLSLINLIEGRTGLQVRPAVAPPEAIRAAITRAYGKSA